MELHNRYQESIGAELWKVEGPGGNQENVRTVKV